MGKSSQRYDVSPFVTRLFTDLTETVAELLPALPGEQLGFMDTTMNGGEDWRRNLLSAAGTCQIFIALLSPKYFDGSPWCAIEWDLFAQRQVVSLRKDGAVQPAIIPVQWVPVVGSIPKPISVVQRFSPSLPDDPQFGTLYRTGGIFGLLRRDKEEAYLSIVWELALLIQRLHHDQRTEPKLVTTTKGLRRTFRRRRP
jgi:hypothetical protein